MSDFTVSDVERALDGDGDTRSIVRYEIADQYKDADWVTDGEAEGFWCAKKDDNGFPIVKSIKTVSIDDDEYNDSGSSYEFWSEGGYLHDLGFFKVVDYGNLGDGHEAWSLVQHQDSGRYFRRSGYYSSWDAGTVLDGDIVEVVPAEVKVVRYRPVDGGDTFEYPAVNVK